MKFNAQLKQNIWVVLTITIILIFQPHDGQEHDHHAEQHRHDDDISRAGNKGVLLGDTMQCNPMCVCPFG